MNAVSESIDAVTHDKREEIYALESGETDLEAQQQGSTRASESAYQRFVSGTSRGALFLKAMFILGVFDDDDEVEAGAPTEAPETAVEAE